MSLELERGMKPKQIEMPPLPPEDIISKEPVMEASHEKHEGVSQQLTQENMPQGEAIQEIPEAHAQSVSQQQPLPSTPERETPQAKNFRELRQQAERAQRERDEFEKRCRELESKVSQKDELNLSPDDLVEGKHIAQLVKEQREMKQKLQQYEQQSVEQRRMAQAEANLRAQYEDFDKVVNQNTVTLLREKHPDIAERVTKLAHDPQMAFDYAYMAIKQNLLRQGSAGQENFPPRQSDLDAAKAQQNSAKPRPLNTVAAQHTDSPISRMNAFANGEVTPEMQKQLWKEMNDIRKAY